MKELGDDGFLHQSYSPDIIDIFNDMIVNTSKIEIPRKIDLRDRRIEY